MAIMLFAGAYIAGELIVLRMLRFEAHQTAQGWRDFVADRIGPDLEFRPDDTPVENASAIEAAVPASAAGTYLADVRAVAILDSAARRVDDLPPAERRPFDFASPDERIAYERMMEEGSLQILTSEPIVGERTIVFYMPIKTASSTLGGLRLEIDQTETATMMRGGMRAIMMLTLAFAAIGLAVVLLVLWHRIRDRWRAEDEMRYIALHDTLTDLPNRVQFTGSLERAMAASRRTGAMVGLICIDVDNFKDINDTLGHPVGDAVLRSVAARLVASSGPGTTVARLSGDEFAILIEGVAGRASLESAAVRYLRTAGMPHEIDGHELSSTLSLGIAVAPEDGGDANTLLKNGDLALYRAKADGRNTYRFFTPAMDRELRRRRLIEGEMRKAIGTDQFHVHFQPQFELETGRLCGFEALMRWQHPELGNVSPAVFIPIAEDTGQINQLGEWILRAACLKAATWPYDATLAVNLSVAQFRSGDVADIIGRIMVETGLPASRLEVEITETLLLQNTERAMATLQKLRKLGVSIALDDFGTGYSSLSYLSRFPFDKIKIDRAFVQRMTEDDNTAAIVQAIITLARTLGMRILAEGVETHEQLALLRKAGCQQVQGFLFGRPKATVDLPVPEIVRLRADLRRAIG